MTLQEEIRELRERIARLERLAGVPSPESVRAPAPEATPVVQPPIAPSAPSRPAPPEVVFSPPAAPILPVASEPAPVPLSTPPPLPPPHRASDRASDGSAAERWLGRIGIALLFLGVIFFLKVTVDRGWFSPPIQLLVGSVVSIGLVLFGHRSFAERPVFGRILMGGGVACAFAVVLAGRMLYGIVPPGGAFACSVLVAGIGLGLAVWHDARLLAVIAALGGLLSPLLLGADRISAPLLSVHMNVVLCAALVAYAWKGWRELFAVGAVGGWTGLFVATVFGQVVREVGVLAKLGIRFPEWTVLWQVPQGAVLIQGSIVFAALAVCAAPLWRRASKAGAGMPEIAVAAYLVPFFAWLFSGTLWNYFERPRAGLFALLVAVLTILAAVVLWRRMGAAVGQHFAGAGSLMLTLAAMITFTDNAQLAALIVLFLATHAAGRMGGALRVVGHVLGIFLTLGTLAFAANFDETPDVGPVITACLACAALVGASFLQIGKTSTAAYRLLGFWTAASVALATFVDVQAGETWSAVGVAAVATVFAFAWPAAVEVGFSALAVVLLSWLYVFSNLLSRGGTDPQTVPAAIAWLVPAGFFLFRVRTPAIRVVLGAAAHLLVLLTWARAFGTSSFPQLVSIGWAIYAVALLAAAISLSLKFLRILALTTFGVLLIRLFLVDLAELDLIWKSIVFTAIGAIFLGAVYFIPRAVRSGKSNDPES